MMMVANIVPGVSREFPRRVNALLSRSMVVRQLPDEGILLQTASGRQWIFDEGAWREWSGPPLDLEPSSYGAMGDEQ